MVMLWVAGLVVVLLLAVVGQRQLIRHFAHSYYRKSYVPIPLYDQELDNFSLEYPLDDMPWPSSALPYCQSLSLQMIAAQQGAIHPRRYFDFLMGSTYGASELPGGGFAPFGADIETGIALAARYLGLLRRYCNQ
jgi:hypothetical protein